MLVVNLFGAPGAVNSTLSAYLFSQLKMAGYNAELVTEFAKDKVWEESKEVFNNQAYIFGKQYFRISRLLNKVDVVITDSPLLLSDFYNHSQILGEPFSELCLRVFNSFENYNAFITRIMPYNHNGRYQTEKDSDQVRIDLENFLTKRGIACRYYSGDLKSADVLFEDVIDRLYQLNIHPL